MPRPGESSFRLPPFFWGWGRSHSRCRQILRNCIPVSDWRIGYSSARINQRTIGTKSSTRALPLRVLTWLRRLGGRPTVGNFSISGHNSHHAQCLFQRAFYNLSSCHPTLLRQKKLPMLRGVKNGDWGRSTSNKEYLSLPRSKDLRLTFKACTRKAIVSLRLPLLDSPLLIRTFIKQTQPANLQSTAPDHQNSPGKLPRRNGK